MDRYNVISLLGIPVLIFFAWIFSHDRRRMNWRAIGWGTALQFLFAAFLFKVPLGTTLFTVLNGGVLKLLDCAAAGTRFVFGPLALAPGQTGPGGMQSLGFILAFQVFPAIIFFSALVAVLYHLRIMPLLIRGFASVFTRLMRISGAESLCTATNIFAGVESALTVRPFLARMTRSELCLILTAGMATIASSVMALYVLFLREQFPAIAGHLIVASVLSAPAAIVMAKVIMPEGEAPETLGVHVHPTFTRSHNLMEAVIDGANAGVKLVVGISALLIAFLGLMELLNVGLGIVGTWINSAAGLHVDWSFKNLLGYLFYPATLAIGVPLADAMPIARVIGERLILTEVVSYQDLAVLLKAGTVSVRSATLATYALCGFAHVASLAIFVGGTAALAPSRIGDLSRVGLRALLAATLACLMTAAVAGVFVTGQTTFLGP